MSDEVRVDIKTTGDTAGVDKVNASLDGTGRAGQTASAGAQQAAKGMQAVSAAASASSGSIQGLAAAMAQMLPRFQALQAALPVVGLLVAAFVSWKKVIDGLIDAQERSAKGLLDIQNGNAAARVKSLIEAYERMSRELDKAAGNAERLLAAERDMAAAQKSRELTKVDLEESMALQGVDDPLKRQQIQAQYGARRAAVEGAYGVKDAALRGKALDQEKATLEARLSGMETEQQAQMLEFSREGRRLGDMATERRVMNQNTSWGRWLSRGGKLRGDERYAEDMDRLQTDQTTLADAIRKTADAIDKTRAALEANATARQLQPMRAADASDAAQIGARKSAESERQAGAAIKARDDEAAAKARALEQKEADLAAKEKQIADLQTRLDAARGKDAAERADVDRAAGALATAEAGVAGKNWAPARKERAIAPARANLDREQQQARQAAQELATAEADLGATLRSLLSQVQSLQREVATLKNQAANGRADAGGD